MRTLLRWTLPTVGAGLAVVLTGSAAAAAGLSVTATTPVGATTNTPLTWDITTSDATPTSCELDRGGVVVDALTDCADNVSYDVSALAGGTYTLTVWNDTADAVTAGATPETQTSSVDVAPVAPTPTAPAGPSADRSPTWQLGLPTGSTGTCTVTDPVGNVVDAADPCSDPWTSQLGATAASGDYTLSVTATAGGITGAAGTAVYTLDVDAPAAPTVTAPASPDNDPTPSYAVTGVEAGATVDCSAVGPDGALPLASCTSTAATLDLSGAGVSDGTYTVTVTATDAAGNTSTTGSDAYDFDGTAPADPTLTPPASPGADRTPTFAVTEPDAGTWVCTVTGPSTVTVTTCGPSTTLDLAGALDGIYTLTVTVTDAAGNTASGSATYKLDTTAPTAPIIAPDSSAGKDRTPDLSVTEPDGDVTWTCVVTGPSAVSVSSCGATTTLDLAAAADGTYTVTVTVTDEAGNSSSDSATYVLDTTAPTAPVVTPAASSGNDRTPTFSVAEPDSGLTWSCVVTGPSTVTVDTCGASTTLDLAGAVDGTYTLTVSVTDAVGNSSSDSATYVLDTTPPTAPVVTAPASPDNDRTPTFSVAEPDSGLTWSCSVTGPASVTVTTCGPSTTLDLTGKPDGTYTLTVTVTDAVGNSSSDSATYVLDTTPPTAPVVTAPTSPDNDRTPSFSVAEPDSGLTWSCVVTGPAPVTVTTCGATTTLDLTGKPDGTYTLTVTVTDAAGNSSSDSATYVLDTTAPTAPVITPGSSTDNDRTPTFSVAEPDSGLTWSCAVTGPAPVTVTSCGATTTLDLTGKPDGTYTLTVTVTDAAGNSSSDQATYTLDTTPPTAPAVTPGSSTGNDRTPTFSVAEPDSGVTWSCVVTGPSTVTVTSCGPLTSLNLAGAADGTYTLTVTASDAVGNSSSDVATYVLDTVDPTAPVITPGSSSDNDRTPAFSVAEPDSGVTWSCVVTGPAPVTVTSCGISTTLDLTGKPDGTYTLTVTVTDAVGNSSSDSATYVLDTTAPTTPVITPGSSTGNDRTPTLAVAEPDSGVTWSCAVSGPAPVTVTTCGPSTTFDLTGRPDGTYTLTVTITDAVGNSSSSQATYLLDTVAPTAPVITPGSSSDNDRTPTLSVAEPDSGLTWSCVVTGPAAVTVTTCGQSTTFNLTGKPDGTYTLTVTVTDAAGNTSSDSATYVLDTTPPTKPVITPGSSSDNDLTPTFTVTEPDSGVTWTCLVSGPATVTVTTCGLTTTLDLTGAPDGTYTLTVIATDAVGNSSSDSATYVLDTTPPTVPVITPGNSSDNDRTPTFSVTEPDSGLTWSCSVTGPASVTVTTCGPSTTLDLTGKPDGTYTLTVTVTDAVGNSSSDSATYVLDTTPPTAPVVTAPASPANDRTPTFSVVEPDSGVTWSCVVTGPAPVTVTTCGASTTFDLTGKPDGTYTLTVTVTDAVGNSSSDSASYVLDTTAPTKPVVTGPTGPSNDRTPTFSVAEPDGDATLTCSLSGPSGATVTSCGATVTLNLPGADGTYVLTVTATDPYGNAISTTYSFLLDTTAPPTPSVTAPASPAQGRTPSFTVTDAESPVTWSCSVTGPSAVTITTCGPTTTLNLTGAADGTYTVSVVAYDVAGNPSAAGTATYVLDSTAPPAPSVSAPPSLTRSRTVTLTIDDSEPGVALTCRLTSPGGATVFAGACPANGTFDTTGYGDGLYTLVVTATDAARNTSTTTVTWTRDTIPPPAPVVTAPTSPAQGHTPSFTVTDAESGVVWECTVTGPSTVTVTTCGPTTTLDLVGAADGTYVLTVTATDAAGNTSTAASASYVLDTVAPATPTVTGPNGPSRDRTPTFSVGGTEPGVTWSCTVTGPSSASVSTCGPSTTLDLGGAADGTYTLKVYATDAAGNRSLAGTITFLLDTTAPPTPSVIPPSSPSNDPTPTFDISDAEAGVQLTCTLTAPGGGVVYAGSCPGSGTFDTAGFGDGVYTLVVVATDAAGNSASKTVTWTRDVVAPPAPSVTGPNRSPGQTRTPAFGVTDTESGVTYVCWVTGPSTATVTQCGATSRLDLTGADDGTYKLWVAAVDAAGNQSAATSATYILDTTDPATPNVSAPASPAIGRHPTFSISGVEAGGVLTCTLSGPAGSAVTVPSACGTSVTPDLTGAPDGVYTLNVTVTDAAGNVSAVGSASYVLDTTDPTAPGLSIPSGPQNDSTPFLDVTTEPGATLTCTVERYFQLVRTGPCPADGIIDLSGLEDGEFEITVVVTDQAGNTGPAATVTYLLDTAAPARAVLTAPASPSPIRNPAWYWTAEDGASATCVVTNAAGVIVQGPVSCASPFTANLAGLPDGTYTLTVVITDDAGNSSAPASSVFILDRQAPVPPTVVPPTSPDNSRHPAWDISAPSSATLTCTLMRGRTVIWGPAECPADGQFLLGGLPDGTYTLVVTSTDRAGNVSAASVTNYVLDTTAPASPRLDYASPTPSTSTAPYWGFTLPNGTTGRCQLIHDGQVLQTKSCKGAVSFDLSGRPSGTYTVRIVAIDAAGNVSDPLILTYVLGTKAPVQTPTGGTPTGNGGTDGPADDGNGGGGRSTDFPPPPSGDIVQRAIDGISDLATRGANKVVDAIPPPSALIPAIPDKLTRDVSSAVQGVVDAVSQAGGGTGFPLLLLFLVLLFLLMQNRIDRRDPKLALASVVADDTVEFLPPPSRGADR